MLSDINRDRALPERIDIERFVLGAALNEEGAFAQIADVLGANDFFLEKHKRIFLRLQELHERGDALNYVNLGGELEKAPRIANRRRAWLPAFSVR